MPDGFMVAGGLLYFSANDGAHGRELWRSDGTEAGTLLMDVHPVQASKPTLLGVLNNTLLFRGYGPVVGDELWAVDP
jgi:ELWxxDGT repeat protein